MKLYQKMQKMNDVVITFLGMVGLLLAIIEHDDFFAGKGDVRY